MSDTPPDIPAPALHTLPSVDRLVIAAREAGLVEEYGRQAVTRAIRLRLDMVRNRMRSGAKVHADLAGLIVAIGHQLERDAAPTLVRMFNLTGTVLHTNLGRALLPQVAIDAVARVAGDAANLEYDLATGSRGDRDSHVEELICRITGAEAATVVNNNAAAVILVLNTLALGKSVPVSRGELVEIGGSFRIPDVMSRASCRLVEVGTTNRTHLRDFANAIGADTALIMKVHTSNYVIDGFTANVPEVELATLCRQNGLPFVNDLGSGTLVDLERYGLPHEPTPMDALRNGADVVTFSGDKLLGGPQAGLIVGSKKLVRAMKANPLKRALRCDKMTIAALAAVLKLYEDPDRLPARLPTLAALTRPLVDIEAAAHRLAGPVGRVVDPFADVSVVRCDSQIGSGALPTRTIASAGLAIRPRATAPGAGSFGAPENRLADAFRSLPAPVIGRINDGAFVFDLRCLTDEDTFVQQLPDLVLDAPKQP